MNNIHIIMDVNRVIGLLAEELEEIMAQIGE